jgi:hypothetical protein
MEAAFHSRKSHPTQNVLVAIDFDLRFTFVIVRWEGTTHYALILQDALKRENGLRVSKGKTCIVHSFRHDI